MTQKEMEQLEESIKRADDEYHRAMVAALKACTEATEIAFKQYIAKVEQIWKER